MARLRHGARAIPFALPGVDGIEYRLDQFRDLPAVGVIFWSILCPEALAWEDRLMEVQRRHHEAGLRLILIDATDPARHPENAFDVMQRRAYEKGYLVPFLLDDGTVARAYGATRTPELFLFDRTLALRYHGAIAERPEPEARFLLADAVEAVLTGHDPSPPEAEPWGCVIERRAAEAGRA